MSKSDRQAGLLATPFTKIAAAISRNHGVRVVPSNSSCCTDGVVIRVPFSAEIARGATLQTLNGMLDHELGHVLVEGECKRAGVDGFVQLLNNVSRRDRELAMLMNVVEDVRIEQNLGREYPGMNENLAKLNERMARLRRESAAKGEHESLWREIACGFIARARGFDHSWMTSKATHYLDKCEDLVRRAAELGVGVKGMMDGIALAGELKNRLREIADERRRLPPPFVKELGNEDVDPSRVDHVGELGDEPEGDEGEDGEDDEDGESKDGEGKGDESKDDEDGEGDEGEGDEDGKSKGDEGDEGEGDEDGKSKGDEGEDGKDDEDGEGDEREAELAPSELGEAPDFVDHRDELRAALDADLLDNARGLGIQLPHPMCLELDVWRLAKEGDCRKDPYAAVKSEVSAQIGALRQKQIARIQTRARAYLSVGLDDGDLDQSRLHEVALGARDVYSEIRPGRHVNVAIQVLLDLSASITSFDCDHFMRRTLVALSESWEPIKGISYDILGFHNFFHAPESAPIEFKRLRLGRQPDGVHYVRMPFEMIHFKQYHESISAFRSRFMEVAAHCDNCDHEAVWMAAKRLAVRPEQRKILCVINDGAPESRGVDWPTATNGLRSNIRAITNAGIEVWGVGAGTDAPKRFYNKETGAKNVCIKDLGSMASTLLGLFSKRIEEF